MELRNEILPVKELTKRFVSVKYRSLQLSEEKPNMIEKKQVIKLGYKKVIGLQIKDIKNPKWTKELADKLNTTSNPFYMPEYITVNTWIFE